MDYHEALWLRGSGVALMCEPLSCDAFEAPLDPKRLRGNRLDEVGCRALPSPRVGRPRIVECGCSQDRPDQQCCVKYVKYRAEILDPIIVFRCFLPYLFLDVGLSRHWVGSDGAGNTRVGFPFRLWRGRVR